MFYDHRSAQLPRTKLLSPRTIARYTPLQDQQH